MHPSILKFISLPALTGDRITDPHHTSCSSHGTRPQPYYSAQCQAPPDSWQCPIYWPTCGPGPAVGSARLGIH